MRTALVTGASGQVGRRVFGRLEQTGWHARSLDLKSGADLRDEHAVRAAVEGCDVIVHAGAIAHDSAGTPGDIISTNVLGTWHVLLAAERCGVAKVVYFSSAQVFGFADDEGAPEYLPVDDAHPLRAARPYGMSKRLAEEMCAAWTSRTSIATVVLRPVMILDDAGLEVITADEAELGAFVHVDDVVDATMRAVNGNATGHHRMTLCGPGDFDTSVARRLLGWTPNRSWPTRA
jgi:nucleoside-diphosphate-sugar epimerase